ncbi:ras-related protein Rab-40C isoform X2 [Tursiops truncatus]|uniref:small monomeric GTPase n=1 Tax=Tursiops truncatus TaxID=9739 RepID=A0A6J3Q059_TURTR|nr:ras-related protein Rab-40C isoform X2 [Tursiops truncatus]
MQERKSRLLGHPERRLAAFIPPRPATPSPRPRRGTAASESAVLGGPRCPLRGLCGSSGHSFLGGSVLLDPAASPQLGDRHHPAPSAEGRGRMQTTWSSKFLIGIDYKTTTILLDGRRVKLELWDTSGQGRFCTIFRSYSRGAQGILLVYDITNRWSFDGIDRWIKEIDEHAPGVPRILVGNRLHLAFKRQVPTEQARAYAEKNCMTFFEVSPLCNFNVIESFTELSRIVLMRHGMEKIWRPNRVFSLQDLCCRAIVSCTPVHLIDKLPLPVTIKSHLKSFSMANGMNAVMMHGRSYSLATGAGGGGSKGNSLKRSKSIRPPQSPPQNCSRSNCKIS